MVKQQKVLPDESIAIGKSSDLEDFVGYNLKRAYMIIHTDFRNVQGDKGLAPRVFSALCLVVQYPNVTQSELARLLGIERSGLVAIIDELEDRGFLRRTTVPGDRRVQALVATDAGRDAQQVSRNAILEHENDVMSDLSDAEKATLIDILRKIRSKEAK